MRKILIVDDNPIITKIYRERFAQAGYQAEIAENGFMAMKAVLALRPDIVLLDLMMPIMHGVDVLRYIRTTPELKSIPVIILSEAYMSDLAQEAA
jgi:CheY-like chemotaxis protein